MSRALFYAHFSKFTGSFNPCSTPQTIPTRLFLQHRSTSPLPWGSLQQFRTYTHGHKHTHSTTERLSIEKLSIQQRSQLSFPGTTTTYPCVPSTTECGSVLRNVPRSQSLPKQVPHKVKVLR
uniref:(northern house mosquito) hypothetical protein n=1 Tax=Culex pipiens TaxID=7175 RepID=A0A8D8B078_CULPI